MVCQIIVGFLYILAVGGFILGTSLLAFDIVISASFFSLFAARSSISTAQF